MEITKDLLTAQLAGFRQQRDKANQEAVAVSGAIMLVELLLHKIEEPEPIKVPVASEGIHLVPPRTDTTVPSQGDA